MLTGNATEPSRTSFRGPSPRLAAAQPPNQASGSPVIDLVLDSIEASDLEREVAEIVCRVDGARSALRVVGGFIEAKKEQLNLR